MPAKPAVSAAFALSLAGLLSVCQDPETLERPRTPMQEASSTDAEPQRADADVGPGVAPSDSGVTPSTPDADLSSDVFGSGGAGETGEQIPACDYSTPGCDFTRIEGCCRAKACNRANGADVFNTYPIESCEALLECVKSHPGCSTKTDPLCFQDEAPDAPCLQEGYQASHTDPDGPYAWTADLVACICGY